MGGLREERFSGSGERERGIEGSGERERGIEGSGERGIEGIGDDLWRW